MSAISNTCKFIFIHIPRTGGTTLKKILTEQVNDLFIFPNEYPTIRKISFLNSDFRNFYKFTYVRNPYDWVVSLYAKISSDNNDLDYKSIKNLSFYDFIVWLCDDAMKRKEDGVKPFYRLQTEYFQIDNEYLIDKIYRFEDLCNDMGGSNAHSLFNTLNLDFPRHIPLISKSERKFAYQDYYDFNSYKLVNQFFKSDFELLKYKTRY